VYVACESGVVQTFRADGRDLVSLGELRIHRAHTVAVDPTTHLVFLPIERLGTGPVLEIYRPADPDGS
jgi:hypothetical protein